MDNTHTSDVPDHGDQKSWQLVPGVHFTQIAAAQGGTVWGVGSSVSGANVYRRKGSSWDSAPGEERLTQVAAGSESAIWGVNADAADNVRRHNVVTEGVPLWPKVRGHMTYVVVAGPNGPVFGYDDGWIYHWTGEAARYSKPGASWERWVKTPCTFAQFAISRQHDIWGVDSDATWDNVYRWHSDESFVGAANEGGAWEIVPGVHLTQIAAAADGSVWGLNENEERDNVYCWEGGSWKRLAGRHLTQIAVGSKSEIWGIDANQSGDNVYKVSEFVFAEGGLSAEQLSKSQRKWPSSATVTPVGLGLLLNRIHFDSVQPQDHSQIAREARFGYRRSQDAPDMETVRRTPATLPRDNQPLAPMTDFVPAEPAPSKADVVLEQTGHRAWQFLRRRSTPRNEPKDRYSRPVHLLETVRTPNCLRLFDPGKKDIYEVDLKTGKLTIRSTVRPQSIEVFRYARGTAGRLTTAAEWFCVITRSSRSGGELMRHFERERASNPNSYDTWLEIGSDGTTLRTYEARNLVAEDGRRLRRLVLSATEVTEISMHNGKLVRREHLVLGEGESGEIALGRVQIDPAEILSGVDQLPLSPGEVIMSSRRSPRHARKILLGSTPASAPRVLLANTEGDQWTAIRLSTYAVIGYYETETRGPHGLTLKNRKTGSTVEIDFDLETVHRSTPQPDGTQRRIRMGAICDYDSFMNVHPADVVAPEMISHIRLRAPDSKPGAPWTTELVRLTDDEWLDRAANKEPGGLGRLVVRAQTHSRLYLQNEERSSVWLCVDLETDKVTKEEHIGESWVAKDYGKISEVRSLLGARRVNEVTFRQIDVPNGVLRQIGFASWIEVREGSAAPVNYWDEVDRTDDEIWLFDRFRELYLTVSYGPRDGDGDKMEGEILITNSRPPQWVDAKPYTLCFLIPSEGRGKEAAPYWSATKSDRSDEQGASCEIVGAARRGEDWRVVGRITERSIFTSEKVRHADLPEELRADVAPHECTRAPVPEATEGASRCDCGKVIADPCSCGPLADLPVFRTSVTLPEQTSFVDIFAEKETLVLVRGVWCRVDPDKRVRVFVEQMGKLTISLHAKDFGCPALWLRTDRMKPNERHNILLDAPLFHKLQRMTKEELAGHARKAVADLPYEERPDEHTVTAVTGAFHQLAQMSLYTYNDTSHGVHHGRAVYAPVRENSATRVNLKKDNGQLPFEVMNVGDANDVISQATFWEPDAAGQEDFWSWLGDRFEDVGNIVVTTVETVETAGTKVFTAVEHAAADAVETFNTVGEDILRGDFSDAFSDLIQGGELVAGDLASGVLGAGTELLKGGGKMAMLVIDVAGEAFKFVVDNVPFLKRSITFVTEKLGKAAGGLLRLLLDPIGWDSVVKVQKEIKKLALLGIDRLAENVQTMKTTTVRGFARLTDDIDKRLLAAIPEGTRPAMPGTPEPHPKHSEAIAWIEWLFSKYYEHIAHPNPVASIADKGMSILHPEMVSPINELRKTFEDEMSRDGGRLRRPFEDSLDQLLSVFEDVSAVGEHVLAAIVDVVRGFVGVGLDLVLKTVTTLLEIAEAAIKSFKEIAIAPWNIPVLSDFYRELVEDELSLVSLVATCGAIPVALIRSFEGYTDEFELTSPQSNESEELSRHLALTYGSMHVILGCTATIANLFAKSSKLFSKKAAAPTASAGSIDDDVANFDEEVELPDLPPAPAVLPAPAGQEVSSRDAGALIFGHFNLLVGLTAQMTGTPIPFNETFETPAREAANDILEAPNRWSHVVWWTLWVMYAKDVAFFGTALGGTLGSSGAATGAKTFADKWADLVNSLGGCIMFAMMCCFDQYEKAKRDAVNKIFADQEFQRRRDVVQNYPFAMARADEVVKAVPAYSEHTPYKRPTNEEDAKKWLEKLEGYHKWATKGPPNDVDQLALKHGGNFMDCLPAIGRLGFSELLKGPAAMVGILGGGALELLGHMIEGSIVIDRARNDNLY